MLLSQATALRVLKTQGIMKPEINLTNFETPTIPPIKVTKVNAERYSAILYIIHCYRYRRDSAKPSVVFISSTGFLTLYFKSRNLTNYINEMKRIGILREYNGFYSYRDKPHCKQYVWFPQNEETIKQLLHKHGIKMFNPKAHSHHSLLFSKINTNLLRFTSDTNIARPEKLDPLDMAAFIKVELRKRYPMLEIHQEMVNQLNVQFYSNKPERMISYEPNVGFSAKYKSVTSIGIRYNCDFCSFTKIRRAGMNNRYDYLAEQGLDLHYDVSGSVPRISRLLNFGVWEDSKYDPYEAMFKLACLQLPNEKCEWGVVMRENFKAYFMECYFEKSVETHVAHTIRELTRKGVATRFTKDALYQMYVEFGNAMFPITGKSIGSEIFFHESNIYIEVLKTMLEDGFDCVTCYDCFYASKKGVTQDEFENYMDNLITKTALGYASALKSTLGR